MERFSSEPGMLAVLVGGSVAHGLARPDSDVDFMLVLDDEAAARMPETFFDASAADYDGGYADFKAFGRGFLDEVAERGSEPARWAFEDAIVAWSGDDGVEGAVRAAAAYPETEREQKLRDLVGHAGIAAWYVGEAERRGEPYLTQWSSVQTVLYAGRVVLAHNRCLFPFHKWFLHALEAVPERPPALMADVHELLAAPRRETATRLVEGVQELTGLRPPIGESALSFARRTELAWRTGSAPFAES